MLDDVQKITIGIILDASRKKIEETPLDPVDCEHCGKSGAISMREVIREDDSDEEMLGYEFTIACICTNGENYKRINECPRWNGKDYQYNGPRLLKMSWPISGVKGNDRRIDSNNNRPNDNGRDSLDGEEVPF